MYMTENNVYIMIQIQARSHQFLLTGLTRATWQTRIIIFERMVMLSALGDVEMMTKAVITPAHAISILPAQNIRLLVVK
jgi:hypothetical protein